jgi:mRNA interferase RelE/StbE
VCQIRYMQLAVQDMLDLDAPVTKRIPKRVEWLAQNFDALTPEALEGEWKGKFKFRIGDYRVIYTVNRDEIYLMIHLVKHRSVSVAIKGERER